MKKKKISGKTLFIILSLVSIGILTAIGTYAYFGWSSTEVNKDASISVTSVNGLGQCNKSSDNQKILWPVSNRNNGRIVTVSTKQTLSEYAYVTWTLTIDSINTQETETAGLKHQTFKYELVNTTTGVSYGSGNFQNLDVGDTITFNNNTENLAYDTNYTFTLYLWIDGTIGTNPMDMTNQTYEFSLVCDITGEPTNKVNELIINPITDYEYTLFPKSETNLDEDYVLLLKYIGTSTNVVIPDTYTIDNIRYKVVLYSYNSVPGSPAADYYLSTFKDNDIIMFVTFLSDNSLYSSSSASPGTLTLRNGGLPAMFTNCSNLLAVYNIPNSVTNMFYTFKGCTSLIDAPEIPNLVTAMEGTFYDCTSLVNAPVIPNSVTSLYKTFYDCTSLVNAPEIPNSVTNVSWTFYGCTSLASAPAIPSSVTGMANTFMQCTNLTGVIRINSSNVTGLYGRVWNYGPDGFHPFYNTVEPITVEVPAGSTTYTNMNTGKPANVTVTTFTPE